MRVNVIVLPWMDLIGLKLISRHNNSLTSCTVGVWTTGWSMQECVEHTLRKDQKITKNTKNICLKDKKEKKQINNAGFW